MTSCVKNIEHKGIVSRIDNNTVIVKIECASACGSCQAKGLCGESADKFIEVPLNNLDLEIGDSVTLQMSRDQGIAAVVLGYVMPFVVFIMILIITLQCGLSELISGLLSLVSIVIYYLCIYLFKRKIDKRFTLIIK